MPFILCFTVLASVGLGVFAAYVAVFGMLFTFSRPAQSEPACDAGLGSHADSSQQRFGG